MDRLEHKGKSCEEMHPGEEHEMWENSQLEGKTEEEYEDILKASAKDVCSLDTLNKF